MSSYEQVVNGDGYIHYDVSSIMSMAVPYPDRGMAFIIKKDQRLVLYTKQCPYGIELVGINIAEEILGMCIDPNDSTVIYILMKSYIVRAQGNISNNINFPSKLQPRKGQFYMTKKGTFIIGDINYNWYLLRFVNQILEMSNSMFDKPVKHVTALRSGGFAYIHTNKLIYITDEDNDKCVKTIVLKFILGSQ